MSAVLEEGISAQTLAVQMQVGESQISMIKNGLSAVEFAELWEVDSPEMAEAATIQVRQLDAQAKTLDDERKAFVKPAREIVDRANGLFMPSIQSIQEASQNLRRKILAWKAREDQRQLELRNKVEAEERIARQKAEAEAAAAQAKANAEAAEQRRKAQIAEEAQRKALAEGRAKDAARLAAEAAAAESKAQSAIENGQAKAEEVILHAAASSAPVPALHVMPKGTSTRENWKALPDGEDWKIRVVRYIAANPQYIELLDLNESAANKLAKALKSAMQIDGLVATNVPDLAIRKK